MRSTGAAADSEIAGRLGAILDAVDDGITVQDPTGRVVYANRTAVQLIGFESPEELLAASPAEIIARFELFDASGAPMSVAALPGRQALAGLTVEAANVGFRVLATGELRWARVRAQPLLGDDGAVLYAINTFHDITERVQVEAELRDSEARARLLVEAMPQIAWTTDAAGNLEMVNRRWSEYTGLAAGERPPLADEAIHPEDLPAVNAEWATSLAAGEPFEVQARIRRADGVYRWHLIRAVPLREADGRIGRWIGTTTDIDEAESDRRFLAEATSLLSSSLDYEETIRRVAELAVPRVADWCVVDLVGPGGSIEPLAIAHVDAQRVADARALRDRYPPDPDAPGGVAAVIRTARSELVANLSAEMLEAIPDPEYRTLIQEMGLRSYMSVPLVAGGEVLGAISFLAAESGRHFDAEDLALAESLGSRAGAAIQNARLFRDVSRYKRILDATIDAVLMFDPETLRLSYVNQGATEQLGYERDELLAMQAHGITDDLDAEALWTLIEPLVAGRLESRTVTLTHRHRSGRAVPVEVLLQHVELPGERGRVVAIARDISDRVAAQARLQRLAEAEHSRAAELNAVIRAMGEGVIVCEAGGRITLANPAAEELFPGVADGTYQDVLDRIEDPAREAPSLGGRGGPIELRIRGDADRWIELSTYPVMWRTSRAGETDRGETIVLLRDVTVPRQRQALRDTFIGVLSHELRTPVTTIYAGSKVLARGGERLEGSVAQGIFEDIHVEAERLHRLVEDVIALQRFGDEEGDVGNEPVLLQRVLPAVIRSEELRWPGVTFHLRIPPGIPTVVADPTYVEQVVRNLLSNAAKYGGSGSSVEAVLEATDSEVLVRILDDGPGFPEAEAERLFELFYRSPSTAASASGAGIGLFVCARLIRAMGGRIWAQPRAGRGAEFGFSLLVMPDE
ncbi:MAG TPA: PAS domain S-box protein [Candidatus Limnocylindrales bacterium]